MRGSRTKTVALYGMLVAVALVLSWAEAQMPAFFAVPGMKIGLTNIVVLLALYLLGEKSAVFINLVRILLVFFLFGSGLGVLYSLAGGALSTAVMILLKKTGRLKIVTVSIAGGLCHNIGQILVAMALMRTKSIAWYLLVLWFTGLAAGAATGIISGILCARLKKVIRKTDGQEGPV